MERGIDYKGVAKIFQTGKGGRGVNVPHPWYLHSPLQMFAYSYGEFLRMVGGGKGGGEPFAQNMFAQILRNSLKETRVIGSTVVELYRK